jgi:hypothetical protein
VVLLSLVPATFSTAFSFSRCIITACLSGHLSPQAWNVRDAYDRRPFDRFHAQKHRIQKPSTALAHADILSEDGACNNFRSFSSAFKKTTNLFFNMERSTHTYANSRSLAGAREAPPPSTLTFTYAFPSLTRKLFLPSKQ